MPLAVQYLKGGVLQAQFGLDVADYTLSGGAVATNFYVVKDSQDAIYILCLGTTNVNQNIKILKVTKLGVKTVATILQAYPSQRPDESAMQLARDENYIYLILSTAISTTAARTLFQIPTSFSNGGSVSPVSFVNVGNYNVSCKFAIYQDRYIWVASGTTVNIYGYASKSLLDFETIVASLAFCADNSGTSAVAYSISANTLSKLVFNTIDTITKTDYTVTGAFTNAKQMLMDKWGDLIVLTNTGTASTLLKYTTAGVQIGTTLNLGGAFYNLNTDMNGNYYYSNSLGSYKIAANTAQGQAFSGLGVLRRGSGMTTYGNNTEGYNPAVFGPQE